MTTTGKYLTLVATVEAPNDDVWDQILARRVHALLEELGLRLAPCGWTPDPDTIADNLDWAADDLPARVTVIDMNPPRINYISMTGVCLKCGEGYIPDSDDDLVHLMTEDGEECGGEGVITGGWGLQRS